MIYKTATVSILLICLFFCLIPAQDAEPFHFRFTQESLQLEKVQSYRLTLEIQVDPGYYLYRDMFSIKTDPLPGIVFEDPIYATPRKKYDKILEEEKLVYTGKNTFTVPFRIAPSAPPTGTITVLVDYQGCSSTSCFLPQTKTLKISFTVAEGSAPGVQEEISSPSPAEKPLEEAKTPTKEQKNEDESGGFFDTIMGFFDKLADNIRQNLEEGNFFLAFLFLFLAGIGTSFTPCVYPVIPITVSIFGARDAESKLKSFLLSLIYAQGIGLMYGALGVAAALAGSVFGQHMSNPWVVGTIALIFILMGLYMAGVLHFNLPSSFQTKASGIGGRGFLGAFSMGLVSGVIMAPCTGPVLLGILTWISTTRDVTLGFFLCYIYAMGIGLLFIALGVSSSLIAKLPKSGEWMDVVKGIFAVIMFTAALYFLKDVYHFLEMDFIGRPILYLGGALMIVLGVVFKGLKIDLLQAKNVGARLRKAASLLLLTCGAFFIILGFLRVDLLGNWQKDLDIAQTRARAAGKPVMIDFHATWCGECKKLDKVTFNNPAVQEELERFVLVKIDMTNSTEKSKLLEKKYNIKGLPLVSFHDSSGDLLSEPRVVSFVQPDEFLKVLKKIK